MDHNATAEIMEVVRKSLPQQVGETLQKELAELQALRQTKVTLEESVRKLTESSAALSRDLAAARQAIAQHEALDKRLADVASREQKQELRDLRVDLAELRRKDAFDLVSMVFRSPVYSENVTGRIPLPVDGYSGGNGMSGCPGMVQEGNLNVTRTVTQG